MCRDTRRIGRERCASRCSTHPIRLLHFQFILTFQLLSNLYPPSTENVKSFVLYLTLRYVQVSQIQVLLVAPPQVNVLTSFGTPKSSLTSVACIPIQSLSIFVSLKGDGLTRSAHPVINTIKITAIKCNDLLRTLVCPLNPNNLKKHTFHLLI